MKISTHPALQEAHARLGRALLALGLLLVLGTACGDSQPEPGPMPPAGTSADEGTAPEAPAAPQTAPRGDVAVEVGEGDIPEGFPDDLPLYPDARPTRWMAAEGPGSLVVFEVDSDPEAVFEFFTAELPGAGWALESESATSTHWGVIAAKSGRKARISIVSAAGGGSEFGVAVAGD